MFVGKGKRHEVKLKLFLLVMRLGSGKVDAWADHQVSEGIKLGTCSQDNIRVSLISSVELLGKEHFHSIMPYSGGT